MNRVDRDVADRQVFVIVAIGGHIAAAALDAHFDGELAAFADSCDVQVAIEHFNIVVGFDLAAHDLARSVYADARDAGPFADHLERNLLQVQDDVGCVFDNAGNGTELMRNSLDAHARDGGAFDGAQQDTAETGADGGPESTLERLRRELTVTLGKGFGIRD